MTTTKEDTRLSIDTLAKKGRKATKKGVALYAGYKTAKKVAKQAADVICHEWSVDCDYDEALYDAALFVAEGNRLSASLLKRQRIQSHREEERHELTNNWETLLIPGAPFVQARKSAYDVIAFRAPRLRDIEALKVVLEAAKEKRAAEGFTFSTDDYAPQTSIMSYGKDGWEHRKTRNSRSFNSVFLPVELQQEIQADLKSFSESRERLQRLELPWRRGYLLSGPPGTGKTSLSLAIAGSLGFNLASLSLTDIKSDGDLREAVSNLRGHTVLVIEDIDAYSVSHDRNHNAARDGALSLSGLLNSLDGFETPDGLVTIATTNHVEHLDSALVRSGRLDRTFHLGYIEAPELERLFAWFYETKAPAAAPTMLGVAGISPAEVAEQFKQHLNDPQGGWDAVLNMATKRLAKAVEEGVAA